MNPTPDPTIRLVTAFETADAGIVGLANSILDEAGIDHVVRGALGQDSGSVVYPVAPATFQVREEDADQAAALLSQLSSPASLRTPSSPWARWGRREYVFMTIEIVGFSWLQRNVNLWAAFAFLAVCFVVDLWTRDRFS